MHDSQKRPLSPHLTAYKMTRYTLLSSFSNRVTGVGLSFGLLVLVLWLVAIARGPLAYERASGYLSAWPMKVLYALFIVAFVYHLIAGIRHLVWDTGRGLERRQSQRSAWIILAVTMIIVLALAWWLSAAQVLSR